jgi:hypothetical protein
MPSSATELVDVLVWGTVPGGLVGFCDRSEVLGAETVHQRGTGGFLVWHEG